MDTQKIMVSKHVSPASNMTCFLFSIFKFLGCKWCASIMHLTGLLHVNIIESFRPVNNFQLEQKLPKF